MIDFLTLQTITPNPTLITIIYTVLLAFALSTLIAITYDRTFKGLSYSRNFVQSLILSAIVSSTVMQAIGDSLARGLGMIGALAIVRFRTNFKDSRDIIFMFASLAAGIAVGVYGYTVAIIGTLAFCFVALMLNITPFGQSSAFDGMLRFNIETNSGSKAELEKILSEYCSIFALMTLREIMQGNRLDYAYHIKLKKGRDDADLIAKLRNVDTIKNIALLLQETTVEL